MNAATSAAPPALCPFDGRHRRRITPSLPPPSLSISSSLFRRRRSLPDPRDRRDELSFDPGDIACRISSAAARLRRSSVGRLRLLLSAGADAYHDLRASVRVDRGGRVVFSCRQSSLLFFANLFLWSVLLVLAARALRWIWSGLRSRSRWGFGNWAVVRRRDRSLGGREVVVGRRVRRGREAEKMSSWNSVSPLSPPRGTGLKDKESVSRRQLEWQKKLPEWWPESTHSPVVAVGNQEFQREADRLVRAIMENRMSGEDYKHYDILQLRQICKISGAKVSFETVNGRDSFYRAAVDFVMNTCSRAMQPTEEVQIDGEEARHFLSGLADSIGLQNFRAATLVRAAVAARTRSCFLQCWASEIQGKRSEALEELSKICLIHKIFPPEENSPEMEMVASGLKRNLQAEQREHLLTLYTRVCGAKSQRIAAEALGLVTSS